MRESPFHSLQFHCRLKSLPISSLGQDLLQKASLTNHVIWRCFLPFVFFLIRDVVRWTTCPLEKGHPQVSGLVEEGNGKWISLALFEKWDMSTARLHTWIREQGSPDMAWMDLGVRLAGVLCWSEKSCKFLWDQVRFPVWACLDHLHFVPNVSDSISVSYSSFWSSPY